MIDRAYLIKRDKSRTALKPTSDAPWVSVAGRRHRRDDYGAQVLVQFVRRNHDARPRLLDFATKRRVQPDQVNVASPVPLQLVELSRRRVVE